MPEASSSVKPEASFPFDGFDESSYFGDLAEALFGICQDNSPGGDLCHTAMRELYCLFRMPVIYRGFRYSQVQATELCREQFPPFYPDIVECLFVPATFVLCLAERRWPPEATDLFNVDDWTPQFQWDVLSIDHIQALNFFHYRAEVTYSAGWFYGEVKLDGAIARISPPAMHLVENMWMASPRDGAEAVCAGASLLFTPNEIRVPCLGMIWGYSFPPGPGYFSGPYVDLLAFRPRVSD
jgi:hypothetical protein